MGDDSSFPVDTMRLHPPSTIPRAARLTRTLPLAALLVALCATPARACSIAPSFWVRDENVPAMVLQALPDSVYMGLFVPTRYDDRTGAAMPDSTEARRVYGQVFRVRRVVAAGAAPAAEVRPGARIVLLRWALGASCGDEAPSRAIQVRPGELTFHTPHLRPRAQWVGGVPTFESSAFDEHTYVPARFRSSAGWMARLLGRGPLSVEEYVRVYREIPGREAWLGDPDAAADRVRRWARANPRLTRREPVKTMLTTLDYTQERMREEAVEARRRGAAPAP